MFKLLPRVAALVFGLAACGHASDAQLHGTQLPDAPAPAIALTDQHDAAWTLDASRGKAVALFFGYTHCDDVCPATLAMLTHVVSTMHDPSRAQVVFVTVDPDRDSVPVMAHYLAQFQLAPVTGLTGTRTRLQPVWTAYHVWSQKIPGKHPGNYEMAHNSAIYLIDANGHLRAMHDWNDKEADVRSDLEALAG